LQRRSKYGAKKAKAKKWCSNLMNRSI
jgi:hypothetical protein